MRHFKGEHFRGRTHILIVLVCVCLFVLLFTGIVNSERHRQTRHTAIGRESIEATQLTKQAPPLLSTHGSGLEVADASQHPSDVTVATQLLKIDPAAAISQVIEARLAELRQDLAPEMVQLIGAHLSACIAAKINAETPEQRTRLLRSVELLGPEIARLPYQENEGRFQWCLDYLSNQTDVWAANFNALTGPGSSLLPADAVLGEDKQRLAGCYERAAGAVLGATENSAIANDAVSAFNLAIQDASASYFTPQGKFPLSDSDYKLLESDLQRAVKEAQRQLSESSEAILGMADLDPDGKATLLDDTACAVTSSINGCFYQALGRAVPDTYWQQVSIPPVVSQRALELSERRRALDLLESQQDSAEADESTLQYDESVESDGAGESLIPFGDSLSVLE